MMSRSIYVLVVIAGLAGAAAAQPAPGGGSGGAGSAAAGAPAPDQQPVPVPAAPAIDRAACTAAIAADDAWARELVTTEQMVRIVKNIHGEELVAMSRAAAVKDAESIAKNKRHVIAAYAAMWLLSVAFLVFLWRRQAGLRGQIAQLERDLAAALEDKK
jgi:hypothetical protein